MTDDSDTIKSFCDRQVERFADMSKGCLDVINEMDIEPIGKSIFKLIIAAAQLDFWKETMDNLMKEHVELLAKENANDKNNEETIMQTSGNESKGNAH